MKSSLRFKPIGAAALAALFSLISGCALQPWVKPHERERLADPMLKWSESPLSERHRERLRVRTEGARGAASVPGVGREDQ